MSNREQNITDLAVEIAQQFNSAKTARGDLASLSTSSRGNLVAAINEVLSIAQSIEETEIDDQTTSTTKTWSSSQITNRVETAVAELVDSAPGTLDTLKELADAISNSDADISAIMTSLGNRVRVDAVQNFESAQKTTARNNIGAASAEALGDPDHDFVADFNTALS